MGVSITSRRRYRCLALAAISDDVLSIPWFQLAVLQVKFSSSIRSTATWPKIRRNGEYLIVRLTMIPSAQSTAGRWSIHIFFGSSEHAVRLDSSSAIGLCPCWFTLLAAAWYRVTVSLQIL